jgi:alkylation response protein AidB-like acyl-CoA dehydrogenase
MTTIHKANRVDRLLSAIDALHDLVQSEAETAERLNRPTPATQRALRESGVFRALLSEELGGFGAEPSEMLEIIEHVSYLDPSLGWLVRVIASETANVANHLPRAVLDELGAGIDDLLVAGQAAVVGGTAIPDAGGYRFTGSWRYAPGLAMATHVALCVSLEGTDDVLLGVVGREQLRIQDNWNVLGLRASASFDYDADDLFVPARFTFHPHAPERVATSVSSRLGPALLSGLHQGAWSQGVGRRLLDELRAVAVLRLDSGDDYLVSDEFYAEFARHYSHVKGTMALLRDTWRSNEETLRAGSPLSDEQETMSRLAASLSTRTVLEISQLVHRFAGAHVMRNGTLQRLFRDAHAGTQHRATANVVTQECGRMIIGALPAGAHWGLFDLVIPDAA